VGYLSNYIVPTAFTVLMHILVMFTVLVGWQLSDTHRYNVETPHFVKAQLVTLAQQQPKPAPVSAAPQPVRKSAPPPTTKTVEKQAPPVVNTVEPKPEPVPVQPTVPDPEIQRQKEREQQEREQKKKQQEQEQQRQQQVQREQQEAMQQEMREEEAMMQAQQDEQTAASYAALVKRTVEGYWSRPPSARKDMQVVLAIRLIPTGEVVGVEVTRSSGNTAFDRSAILAVEKAARFPELSDMPPGVFDTYFRSFTLVFKPEDLLL
jgi:colicin import membrane protein